MRFLPLLKNWLITPFVMCILFFSFFISNYAYAQSLYPRQYTYNGLVGLSYERYWSDTTDAVAKFTHDYRLGIDGFLLDPRLVSFTTVGNFTQDIYDPGDTINYTGFMFNLDLLNQRPMSGLLFWAPQPVRLRYSHYTANDYENTNYGVSLSYSLPQRIGFFHNGRLVSFVGPGDIYRTYLNNNNNNNSNKRRKGLVVPFPTVVFDYDRYKYDSDAVNTDIGIYNIRGTESTTHASYLAAYEIRDYGGKGVRKYTFDEIDLRADYRYSFNNSRDDFNSYNRYYRTTNENITQWTISDNSYWRKVIGKNRRDLLLTSLTGIYTGLEDAENYSVGLGSNYNKALSPLVNNSVSINVNYGKSGNHTLHSEILRDDLFLRMSRSVNLGFRANTGLNENGPEYGFGTSVGLTRRIGTSFLYYFSSKPFSDKGRSTSHEFGLNFNGRIIRRMFFTLNNTYRLASISDPIAPYNENTLTSTGNLSWYITRYTFNLGGSYIESSKKDGNDEKTWTETINTAISTYLIRGMYLTTAATWSKNNDAYTTVSVKPRLTWSIRKILLALEYDRSEERRVGKECRSRWSPYH